MTYNVDPGCTCTRCRARVPSLTFGASRKGQGPGHDVQHHAVARDERNHTVTLAVSEEEGGDREAQKQSGQHRIHESAHRLGERRDQVEEDDHLCDEGEGLVFWGVVRDERRVDAERAEGDDKRKEKLLCRSSIKEDGHTYDGELAQALDALIVPDVLGITVAHERLNVVWQLPDKLCLLLLKFLSFYGRLISRILHLHVLVKLVVLEVSVAHKRPDVV